MQAAKETAATGATEFSIVAAVRGPDARLMSQVKAGIEAINAAVELNIACSLGMLTQEQVDELKGDGGAPLQPQPGVGALLLPGTLPTTHSFEERWETCVMVARVRHGAVLRRTGRHGGVPGAACRVGRASRPSWSRTRSR